MLVDEVDVVQLVPVDVSPGGNVADDCVVLPAVPQSPDHFDGVGGLIEQVIDIGGVKSGAAAEQRRLVGGRADPRLPTRTPVGDKVSVAMAFETWNGSVRVTVATGANQMCRVTGAMRAATRTASARAGQPARVDLSAEQSPFADGGQLRPVPAADDRLGAQRDPPRVRMPAVTVQREREVNEVGYDAVFSNVFSNAIG